MDYTKIYSDAQAAANDAGAAWLHQAQVKYLVTDTTKKVVGTMLDVCGNAEVEFKDRRSVHFKAFKKLDLIVCNSVLDMKHDYKYKQELGLHKACATAAMLSLTEAGITGLRIWSYVD